MENSFHVGCLEVWPRDGDNWMILGPFFSQSHETWISPKSCAFFSMDFRLRNVWNERGWNGGDLGSLLLDDWGWSHVPIFCWVCWRSRICRKESQTGAELRGNGMKGHSTKEIISRTITSSNFSCIHLLQVFFCAYPQGRIVGIASSCDLKYIGAEQIFRWQFFFTTDLDSCGSWNEINQHLLEKNMWILLPSPLVLWQIWFRILSYRGLTDHGNMTYFPQFFGPDSYGHT